MAANFGELVLLIGDYHIPARASSIPAPFRKMLVPNKMQHVVCTGNIGDSVEYERLKELVGGSASNVHCVAGEYDSPLDGMPPFPETRVVQLGQFRVGIVGGHQAVPRGDLSALAMLRRRMGADVLVSGSRRKEGVVEHEGGYYIFPGSITGAYSSCAPDVAPSFILLAVQGAKVVCYVYELKDGEVDVSKTEFSKQ